MVNYIMKITINWGVFTHLADNEISVILDGTYSQNNVRCSD